MSIGVEKADDLIEDLTQALGRAGHSSPLIRISAYVLSG